MKSVTSQVNLNQIESDVLAFWEKEDIFQKSLDIRSDSEEFTFYDGPPFANGLPHYGHLLANTIKDVVPRYWSMRGFYVDRRFGWDTHGVPVEFEIEKQENLSGRQDILDMGLEVFNEKCRASVLHYAGEWQTTITRLGRWVDWNRQYRTMDRDFMESVWWVFSELYNKDLVYQGYKVVPYSPRITAVLSNFEANQNYQDVQDPALTVKFKLKNSSEFLLAWTTTPWTLISNLALAVSPDLTYIKVKEAATGETLILAKDRLKEVFKLKKKQKAEEVYEILEEISGEDLVGLSYEPLFPYYKDEPKAFHVLSGDFVTADSGTGIVHTAPAYGEDDFKVCRDAGLGLVDPLDEDAKFKSSIPEYEGQFVKDADKNIMKDLKAQGKVFRQDTIVHSYPMCERTNGPLIYRAIPSWYVAVEKFKDNLISNNQQIRWVPGHLKDGRMGKWLENARDWAISRNRFWGTPIPIWVCDHDDSHVHCIGSVAELAEKTGKDITDLHKHHIDNLTFECPHCAGKMKRIEEVFDCWFESGSMPYAQLHYPFENKDRFEKNFPADFIAEGLDQTRGWFYTLSVLSAALKQSPAFKNVVVNGLVLADDGRKMSKRWRNFTPPIELIDEYGADSVRLYMLNSAILRGEDLKFKNEGVKETTRSVILPLWNALSFLTTYAELDKWQPNVALLDEAPETDVELDRWLISRLHSLTADVKTEMEAYQLYNVVPRLIDFIGELTNWYIRLSRRKFWGGTEAMNTETKSAYETLYYTLTNFVKVFAPFAPFTAEKVYLQLTTGLKEVPQSIHLCDMLEPEENLIDKALERKMDLTKTAAELGRSLRAKHQIKTRQALPGVMIIAGSAQDKKALQDAEELIKNELNLKKVDYTVDEAAYVNLSVKPNLRTLGRKLGKGLKDFSKHLVELSANQDEISKLLRSLEQDGHVEILGHELGLADFLIDRGPKDDRLIATGSGITLLLDTKLSPELIAEGLSREIVNRVQNLRKDSGLNIADKIKIIVHGSQEIKAALKANETYVCSETQSIELSIDGKDESPEQFKQSYEIGELSCDVTIVKVNP